MLQLKLLENGVIMAWLEFIKLIRVLEEFLILRLKGLKIVPILGTLKKEVNALELLTSFFISVKII